MAKILKPLPSTFVGLVKYMKKKYKFNQRTIAEILNVSDASISNCLHSRQRNTGDRFIPHLISFIESVENKQAQNVVISDSYNNLREQEILISSEDTKVKSQSFVPTYKYESMFCCAMCSTQQKATVDRSCVKCGFSYNLG